MNQPFICGKGHRFMVAPRMLWSYFVSRKKRFLLPSHGIVLKSHVNMISVCRGCCGVIRVMEKVARKSWNTDYSHGRSLLSVDRRSLHHLNKASICRPWRPELGVYCRVFRQVAAVHVER